MKFVATVILAKATSLTYHRAGNFASQTCAFGAFHADQHGCHAWHTGWTPRLDGVEQDQKGAKFCIM